MWADFFPVRLDRLAGLDAFFRAPPFLALVRRFGHPRRATFFLAAATWITGESGEAGEVLPEAAGKVAGAARKLKMVRETVSALFIKASPPFCFSFVQMRFYPTFNQDTDISVIVKFGAGVRLENFSGRYFLNLIFSFLQ